MKKSWIILLVMIIKLFLIVLINAEENITFIYPKNVEVGKEFEVKIILINFSEDIYDVKIDILNESTNLAKRFWNGTWEYNRWMYNAIDTSKTDNSIFKLNVTKDYNGLTNITIKVRENGKTNLIIERDYQINITHNSNPPQNKTQNPIQNNTPNQESSISLDMDWSKDEIVNGNEFDIEVKAENLKNEKYNVKVWIEFEDNDTIISDRYGEDSSGEEVWKSGSYYVYNLFNGPGNKTEAVNLRIRENYKDFNGDAKIFFKLSSGEEISENIEILEKEENTEVKKQEKVNKNNTEEIKTTIKSAKSTPSTTGNVIRLGDSESKDTTINNKNTENTNLIYKSKDEKIKLYATIGFAILCLGLVILIIFKKIK